ncbi:MAG: hypothetical protein JWO71_4203 [Candidatus Acidoferrum typicum]|nr:hypothetical protein [Candidatus Acidoferrum typicum]
MKKKQKKGAKKPATSSKSRVSAKAKLSARSVSKKSTTKRKRAVRRKPVRENEDVMGSQSVETVPLSAVRPKARSARAGASGGGGGDYSGLSVVAGADSESPRELLEEGQSFEAGIVEAVQDAPDADKGEIRTREVPEDDIPPEYDDDGRPDTGD